MIKCRRCGEEKDESKFHRANIRGEYKQLYYNKKCKQCVSEEGKEKYISKKKRQPWEPKICTYCKELKNISEFRDSGKYKQPLCFDCEKLKSKIQICKKYGITFDIFKETLIKQEGKCLICTNDIGYSLCIDHDHKTGKIRGLLCNNCNKGLGFFRDSPDLMKKAAEYIIKQTK